MRTFLPMMLLLACVDYRTNSINFGEAGEGLDGFLCKDSAGSPLLDRLGKDPDGGVTLEPASLVSDFVDMQGLPGCRTGQMIRWCSGDAGHTCEVMPQTRSCHDIMLPAGFSGMEREDARNAIIQQIAKLKERHEPIIDAAPDRGAILRVVATKQTCQELMASGSLDFDESQLVGCAYSCPAEFNRLDQDVYLGFETLTSACEQGVRICASRVLTWKP